MQTTSQKIRRFNANITDAKKGLTVHVKPRDIIGAECRNHQYCVVARAIRRQRGATCHWVDVGNQVVLIGTSKTSGKRYMLSSEARAQVRFFDQNNGRFAPCTVKLVAPWKNYGKSWSKLGARKGEKHGGKSPSIKSRRSPTR